MLVELRDTTKGSTYGPRHRLTPSKTLQLFRSRNSRFNAHWTTSESLCPTSGCPRKADSYEVLLHRTQPGFLTSFCGAPIQSVATGCSHASSACATAPECSTTRHYFQLSPITSENCVESDSVAALLTPPSKGFRVHFPFAGSGYCVIGLRPLIHCTDYVSTYSTLCKNAGKSASGCLRLLLACVEMSCRGTTRNTKVCACAYFWSSLDETCLEICDCQSEGA